MPNIDESYVRHVLQRFATLLRRQQSLMDGAAVASPNVAVKGKRRPDIASVTDESIGISSLSPYEVLQSLRTLQKVIVLMAGDHLAAVVAELVSIGNKQWPSVPTTTTAPTPSQKTTSKDTSKNTGTMGGMSKFIGMVAKKGEGGPTAPEPSGGHAQTAGDLNAPEYIHLETLHSCLDANRSRLVGHPDALADIGVPLEYFLFDRLQHSRPVDVVRLASLSLGVLSASPDRLLSFVTLVRRKYQLLTEGSLQEIELAPTQAAVRQFQFPQGSDLGIEFVVSLAAAAPRFERSTMIQAALRSLAAVFERLIAGRAPAETTVDEELGLHSRSAGAWMTTEEEGRCAAFWKTLDAGPKGAEFRQAYADVYGMCLKWRKKKERVFGHAVSLMRHMLCLGDVKFFGERLKEFLQLIGKKSQKDAQLRGVCVRQVRRLFENLRKDLFLNDIQMLEKEVQALLQTVFAKRQSPASEDSTELVGALVAVGTVAPTLISGTIHDMLKDKGYAADMRSIALRSLATLSDKFKGPPAAKVAPAVAGLLDETVTTAPSGAVASAASGGVSYHRDLFACLPQFDSGTGEKKQQHVRRIVALLLHHARDQVLTSNGYAALLRYVEEDPALNFLTAIDAIMGALVQPRSFADHDLLVTTFENMHWLSSKFLDIVRDPARASPPTVDESFLAEWSRLRPKIEGVCLVLGMHNGLWVRRAAQRMAVLAAHPILRPGAGAAAPVGAACLMDAAGLGTDLRALEQQTDAEWVEMVRAVVVSRWRDYATAIHYAWKVLLRSWRMPGTPGSEADPSAFDGGSGAASDTLQLWARNLQLLCMCVRAWDGGMPHDEVRGFFVAALEAASKGTREVESDVLSSLARVHESCYELLVTASQEVFGEKSAGGLTDRGRSDKGNKLAAIGTKKHLTQEEMRFHEALLRGIPVGGLRASVHVSEFYGLLFDRWVRTTAAEVSALPLSARATAASACHRIIRLRGQIPSGDVRQLLRFVTALLAPGDKTGASQSQQAPSLGGAAPQQPSAQASAGAEDGVGRDEQHVADIAAIMLLRAALECGPVQSGDVEREIQMFLMSAALRGAHIHSEVFDACASLLCFNRHLAGSFLHHAYADFSLPQLQQLQQQQGQAGGLTLEAHRDTLRVANFNAIVVNVVQDGLSVWSQHFNTSQLLYACILHQCSRNLRMRQTALQLAHAMHADPSASVGPGWEPGMLSHQFSAVQLQRAREFSEAVAARHPELTLPLLAEAVRFHALIGSEDKWLAIRLLVPWVRSCGKILAEAPASSRAELVKSVCEALYQLTYHSVALQSLEAHAASLWIELLTGDETEDASEAVSPIVDDVVLYLCDVFAAAEQKRPPDVYSKGICRRICVYLARTGNAGRVVSLLAQRLRSVPGKQMDPAVGAREFLTAYSRGVMAAFEGDASPSSSKDAAAASELFAKSEPTVMELAAYTFLADLSFEGHPELSAHAPLLLQNSIVLFGPNPFGVRELEGDGPVPDNIMLASLVQLLSRGNVALAPPSAKGAKDKFSTVGPVPSTVAVMAPIAPEDEEDVLVKEFKSLVSQLDAYRPGLRVELAECALHWATFIPDATLSVDSLSVFAAIAEPLSYQSAFALVLIVFVSLRDRDFVRCDAALELAAEMVGRGEADNQACWLLGRLAFALLLSTRLETFSSAATLINELLVIANGTFLTSDVVRDILAEMWAPAAVEGEEWPDALAIRLLSKGLAHPSTRGRTRKLVQGLAVLFSSPAAGGEGSPFSLPADNALVFATLVLYTADVSVGQPSSAADAASFVASLKYPPELLTGVLKAFQLRDQAMASGADGGPSGGAQDEFARRLGEGMRAAFGTDGSSLTLFLSVSVGLLEGLGEAWMMPLFRLIQITLLGRSEYVLPAPLYTRLLRLVLASLQSVHNDGDGVDAIAEQLLAHLQHSVPEGVAPEAFETSRMGAGLASLQAMSPLPSSRPSFTVVKGAVGLDPEKFSAPLQDAPASADESLPIVYQAVLGLDGRYEQESPALKNGPRPEVSGVSPNVAPAGSSVTLRGSNLGVDADDVVSVTVCGRPCEHVEYRNSACLRIRIPEGSGSGPISITTRSGGEGSSEVDFTYGELVGGHRLSDASETSARKVRSGTMSRKRGLRDRKNRRVFGLDLSEVMYVEERTEVPWVVEVLVREIERRGVDIEGLYRVPGRVADVNQMKEAFNRKRATEVALAKWPEIHSVCGVLKQFFRELPDPLLTFELYDNWLEAVRLQGKERADVLKALVAKLPYEHKSTLRYLLRHLRNVIAHASTNKMGAHNVGVVFGPTLMRPRDEAGLAAIQNTSKQAAVVEALIESYDQIF